MTQSAKRRFRCLEWIAAHVGYDGDDCLIWPYALSRGYAQVPLPGGKVRKGSRIMCILAHGEPPTRKHEAAHTCGRGNIGCINPKHLSWKTRSENQQDRRAHGTQGRGREMNERGIGYKLDPAKVAEIRAIGDKESKEELGRRYGVTPSNIAKILMGKTWPTGDYSLRGFAVTKIRPKKELSSVGEYAGPKEE